MHARCNRHGSRWTADARTHLSLIIADMRDLSLVIDCASLERTAGVATATSSSTAPMVVRRGASDLAG